MYFESSPTTLGLYTKIGFVELEKHIVHKAEDLGTPEDVTVPLCIRMPAAANGMTFEEWQAKGYPKFETKPVDTRILAKAASAAAGGADFLDLLENLTAACGGEKNLMALASMASTIGVDKLPGLLSLMGISSPEPAAAAPAAPKAEPAVVKPTETTVETTVEVAQP